MTPNLTDFRVGPWIDVEISDRDTNDNLDVLSTGHSQTLACMHQVNFESFRMLSWHSLSIVMSIHSTEAVISETPSENSLTSSGEITVPIEMEKYAKELRVSSILQSLLDEHKAQSKVVQTLREELDFLEQNPSQYFQGRKMFLYHAYTQTLKEYEGKIEFDVQV